jgi:hypothetical protein
VRYGLVYLAAVPTFALFYALLPPHSLHDSNAGLEPSTFHDAEVLLGDMTRSLNRHVKPGTRWRSGHATFEITSPIDVSRIHYLPSELDAEIELDGQYRGHRPGLITYGNFIEKVDVTPFESLVASRRPGQEIEIEYSARLLNAAPDSTATPQPPLTLLLPPAIEPTKQVLTNDASLTLPARVNTELNAFLGSINGDPYYASGRYTRMLYLSASTITTLGLGDLTPISGWARFLVGLEALTGIVVIGFFLNDLAHLATLRRRDEPA